MFRKGCSTTLYRGRGGVNGRFLGPRRVDSGQGESRLGKRRSATRTLTMASRCRPLSNLNGNVPLPGCEIVPSRTRGVYGVYSPGLSGGERQSGRTHAVSSVRSLSSHSDRRPQRPSSPDNAFSEDIDEFSPKISLTTPNSVWISVTARLLNEHQHNSNILKISDTEDTSPLAQEHRLYEIEKAISYWSQKRHPESAQRVDILWKLWQLHTGRRDNPELLNTVLTRWRWAVQKGGKLQQSHNEVVDEVTAMIDIPKLAQDLPTCRRIWERLTGDDIVLLDDKSYAVLLSTLQNGDFADIDLVDNILDHYLENCPGDNAVVWNAALSVWARMSEQVQKSVSVETERLLARMKQHCKPNARSYACVLQTYRDEPRECQRLLDELENEYGIKPNGVCYLHLLHAWTSVGDVDCADSLLQKLVKDYIASLDSPIVDGRRASQYVVKPTTRLFSVVISAFARQERLDKVKERLQTLQDLYDKTEDHLFLPTAAVLLNSVLATHTRHPEKAQALLESMFDHSIADSVSVNTVLKAWAESGAADAVERTEALLRKMTNRASSVKPNTVSYTTVMKAWARSDRKEAAKRCEAFLNAMWKHNVQPNAVTYATVIYAWSRAKNNRKSAPHRAEAVFEDMMERYKNGNRNLKPTEATYVTLMTTWNRSCMTRKSNRILSRQAQFRVQYYFDQMRGASRVGDVGMQPSMRAYSALMESKKLAGDGVGAEKVLQLLSEESKNYRSEGESLRPTRYIFYAAMSAWAKSGNPRAPEHAEALLNRLIQLHERNGWDDCKPETVGYSIVLNCWAKSGRREAPERAESILEHLQKHTEGNFDADDTLCPNSYCYSAVLDAWARSGRPEAPQRAQKVFDDMMTRYNNGDERCKPSSSAYGALISAWGRNATESDAPTRALAVLNEMEDRFVNEEDSHPRPDCYHYSSVIAAFAQRGDAVNAQLLHERISRAPHIEPNTSCYNGLIKALARSQDSDAPERAESVLRAMQSDTASPRHARPDAITYKHYLAVWRASQDPSSVDHVHSLLGEVVNSEAGRGGVLDASVFLSFLRLLRASSTSQAEAERRARQVLEWMDLLRIRPTRSVLQEVDAIGFGSGRSTRIPSENDLGTFFDTRNTNAE